MQASCPTTTPWSSPAVLSNNPGTIESGIFSAATSAGFMAAWSDNASNAHYSFSSDGIHWQSDVISTATFLANSSPYSDVFVAGNDTGFMVAWVDDSGNGWSNFSTDNGNSWSPAIQINPNTLSLDPSAEVFIAGGSSGFVAGMLVRDPSYSPGNPNYIYDNLYVSFSTGTTVWSAPVQVTTGGPIRNTNVNSPTGRGFVGAVVSGNSCMFTWLGHFQETTSAYFESINPFNSPFSTTSTPSSIYYDGIFGSIPAVAEFDGYFMTSANGGGVVYFSITNTPTTAPANWAIFGFTNPAINPTTNVSAPGPWMAANQAGFMSTWIGDTSGSGSYPDTPMWMLLSDNGFTWGPQCSILNTPITIDGPVILSANSQGFVATWEGSDSNPYAAFYSTPFTPSTPTGSTAFAGRLIQKYGKA